VAQVSLPCKHVDPEFKPQYWKKGRNKEKEIMTFFILP
jgi:hypothetical protein